MHNTRRGEAIAGEFLLEFFANPRECNGRLVLSLSPFNYIMYASEAVQILICLHLLWHSLVTLMSSNTETARGVSTAGIVVASALIVLSIIAIAVLIRALRKDTIYSREAIDAERQNTSRNRSARQ